MVGLDPTASTVAPRSSAAPRGPDQLTLASLTADDLTADAILDRLGLIDRVQVRQLGTSRAGRPIPLLSIGPPDRHTAPNSALIVGAPHPNEPTGCLTVLAMLALLAEDRGFHLTPGWRWHFIPAIDIDGIALNEGWFSASPDISTYADHFYRPSFKLQPEYSFPIGLPGYRFDAETPESACWRRALEITRPRLQCSLHGADTGGSFFLLSGRDRRLADQLAELPRECGVTLNDFGEPLAELTVIRRGVFGFPSVSEIVARAVGSGGTQQTVWNAGDSSAGFADRRFGTFSMTCEVPLWRDAREGDQSLSGRTLGEVIDERIDLIREESEAVALALPDLVPRTDSLAESALAEALADVAAGASGITAALEQLHPNGSDDRQLRQCELVSFEYGTHALRTPAMLARLATLTGATAVASVARSLLDGRIATLRGATHLAAIPSDDATELQMAAVLATAAHLESQG